MFIAMIKKNWRICFIALGALAFIAAMVSASTFVWSQYEIGRRAHQEYVDTAHADQQNSVAQIVAKCNAASAPDSFVLECLKDEIETHQNRDNSRKDLKAQQDIAFWAFWMFVASAFGLAVSTTGLIVLFVSLRQTNTAIKDTREIGEAQVRAYVNIEKCEIKLLGPNKTDDVFMCVVTWKNVGQSPARELQFEFAVRVHATPAPTNYEALKFAFSSVGNSNSCSPGGTEYFIENVGFPIGTATKISAGKLALIVAIRFGYKDVFNRVKRETEYFMTEGELFDGNIMLKGMHIGRTNR